MWWRPLCLSLVGLNLNVLLPLWSAGAAWFPTTHPLWMGRSIRISPPRPIPPSPPAEWMNGTFRPVVVAWPDVLWVDDDGGWWLMMVVMGQQRSHHRRSRKRSRSVVDDDEGHLIYHRGDMLRARCIEYIPFLSLSTSYLLCCCFFIWCTVAKYYSIVDTCIWAGRVYHCIVKCGLVITPRYITSLLVWCVYCVLCFVGLEPCPVLVRQYNAKSISNKAARTFCGRSGVMVVDASHHSSGSN